MGRRPITDRTGDAVIGTIGDVCAVGQAGPAVVDDSMGRSDTRSPEERSGTVTITLPLLDAWWIAGHRVAVFTIEE